MCYCIFNFSVGYTLVTSTCFVETRARKVETLTKAMDVEAKKMRREVVAMEKEVAAMRVDKERDYRAKRLGNSRSSVNSS